jgi:hypothetical protein
MKKVPRALWGIAKQTPIPEERDGSVAQSINAKLLLFRSRRDESLEQSARQCEVCGKRLSKGIYSDERCPGSAGEAVEV